MPARGPFPLLITAPRQNFRELGRNQNAGKGLAICPLTGDSTSRPLTLAGRGIGSMPGVQGKWCSGTWRLGHGRLSASPLGSWSPGAMKKPEMTQRRLPCRGPEVPGHQSSSATYLSIRRGWVSTSRWVTQLKPHGTETSSPHPARPKP